MPSTAPVFVSSYPTLQQLNASMGGGVNLSQAQASGMTDDQFNNLKSTFDNLQKQAQAEADRTYSLSKSKLDNEYNIARQQARTEQDKLDVDRQYKQASTLLAQQRLAEDSRQFDATLGLNQAKLGYDLIGTAAQLRGPDNYFQAANYARGVSQQPGTATFLEALRNNTQMAGFGAQGGAPDAVSLGSLTAKLGGGGGSDSNNYLDSIHGIAAAGGGRLGAGQWEQLTPTEQKLFLSGLEAPDSQGKAYDAPTFLSQYRRSRIGNTGSVSAA